MDDMLIGLGLLVVGLCAMVSGVAFYVAKRVLDRPAAAPAAPERATGLHAQLADLTVTVTALRRQLGELESTVELRHRSLTGFIAKKMGRKAGDEAEQLELPPGPERDAVIDRVLGEQGGASANPSTEPEDPNTWPMHIVAGDSGRRRRR